MDATIPWIFSQWILLILGIGLLIYFYGTKNYNYFLNRNVPFIKPTAFVGNMGPMLTRSMHLPDFVTWMYNELKGHAYGGMFQFRKPVVFIRDPDLIKTVTVKDFDYFTDHYFVVTEEADSMWGKGIFNLRGQRWRDMRTILTPAFTSSKMKTMFVLVDECGKQLVSFLEKCYSGYKPEKPCKVEKEAGILVVELKDLFTRYANDVIATSAFGVGVDSFSKPSNEFYLMGKEATSFNGIRVLVWMANAVIPSLMKMLDIPVITKRIKKYFTLLIKDAMVTRAEKGIIRPDLVQLLMEAKKENLQEENNPNHKKKVLEDEDIVAQAFLFFFAGFDSTSSLLSNACYLLAVHPEKMSKLQDEIDATMRENGGNISYETLHSMKYLDMVISETLRLYPPNVGLDRRCVKNYTLPADPPLEIKAGDGIMIPIHPLHRDPEYFPDPDAFEPERFSDENKHNIKPSTYIPFGAGPRNCIGSRFALMESKIVLVKLLNRFDFKVVLRTPIPAKISKTAMNTSIEDNWIGLEIRNNRLNPH